MSATSDFYLKQAIQNEQDAQAAKLDNVRERHLRSALAWRQMAERLTHAEGIRAAREQHKAADAAFV
jgi:hypothetical protein